MPYTPAQIKQVEDLSQALGVSSTLVKALLGLSKPARAMLRKQLTVQKGILQGKIAQLSFTRSAVQKQRKKLLQIQSAVTSQLSLVKQTMSQLNWGPEFDDEPEIQRIINILVKGAGFKGDSITGYKDIDKIVEDVNYRFAQTIQSEDFATQGINRINQELEFINQIIGILDQL